MELPNKIAEDYFATFTQEPPRPHMGVSEIGHPLRRVVVSFRWAVIETFPGRILSLFRRGQMEGDSCRKYATQGRLIRSLRRWKNKYIDLGLSCRWKP